MRNWLLAIGLSWSVAAHAAPPARVEIVYEVRYNDSAVAEAVHLLEHDGKTYRLSERWEGSGLFSLLGEIRRSSQGKVTPAGLRPLAYEDIRPRREPASARFGWEDGTLVLQFHNGPRTVALPPQAQDRLSFLFAPAFHAPGRRTVEFNVADGKGISYYIFDVAGRERLSVPAGEFDALRLVKREDAADKRSTQIWLDAGRSYLPLRVLAVQKDGARVDQVAARITLSR
jgi:hypothetical protein